MTKGKIMGRIFKYDGSRKGKRSFTVETELTDLEAINLLASKAKDAKMTDRERNEFIAQDSFVATCAFELNKLSQGFKVRDNLIAYAFKLAEEAANPVKPLRISAKVQGVVAHRRPLRDEAEGKPFKVSLCGSRSKRSGHIAISDDAPWGTGGCFYGYAKPVTGQKGVTHYEWLPTRSTPEAIIKALTE